MHCFGAFRYRIWVICFRTDDRLDRECLRKQTDTLDKPSSQAYQHGGWTQYKPLGTLTMALSPCDRMV
jgi:hypothetical protein